MPDESGGGRSSRAATCGHCIAMTFVLNFWMACLGWSAGWVHRAGGCTRTWAPGIGCTRTWAPGIGGAPRDAQAAVDVGATTFGIARSQDRGLGDSTVARAGFHSSISRTIYHAPGAACAIRISGPGRARARPWLEVRLADASPTDGVQDTAATTGGRAGVQQVKLRI